MDFLDAVENKQRIIQEFVPGKQVTIAHIIANPKPELFRKMGLDEKKARSYRYFDDYSR